MESSKEKNGMISAALCFRNLSAMEDALFVIGRTWTLRIMIALLSRQTRFNELQDVHNRCFS